MDYDHRSDNEDEEMVDDAKKKINKERCFVKLGSGYMRI